MLQNVREVIEKAREFLSQEQFDHAERELQHALEKKMVAKDIYFMLGDVYLHKKALKEAEKAFEEVVNFDSKDYLAHLNLGNISLINQDFKKAEHSLSLVFEESEQYRHLVAEPLSEIYLQRDDYYGAYSCFETLLQLSPDDENILCQAAFCLEKKGLVSLARNYLERALTLNPAHADANNVLITLDGKKDLCDKRLMEDNFRKNLNVLKEYYPSLAGRVEEDKAEYIMYLLNDGSYQCRIRKGKNLFWHHGFKNHTYTEEKADTIVSIATESLDNDDPLLFVSMHFGFDIVETFNTQEKYYRERPEQSIHYYFPVYIADTSLASLQVTMRIHDITDLIRSQRHYFLLNQNIEEELTQFFMEEDWRPHPSLIQSTARDLPLSLRVRNKLTEIYDQKHALWKKYKDEIKTYYDQRAEKRLKEVLDRGGSLRVLGVSTIHSTFLQYCMRDVLQAFRALGHETKLLIEPENTSLLSDFLMGKTLALFKPDLIFLIDTTPRMYTSCTIHERIPVIHWYQDELGKMFNKEAGSVVGKKDFFLVLMSGWLKGLIGLTKYGYPSNKLKQQIIPANEDLYKPVSLTPREINRYGCDVSFVKHGAIAPEQCLEGLLDLVPDPASQKVIKVLYEMVRERFLKEQDCFKEDYLDLIAQAEENAQEVIKPEYKDSIFGHFYYGIGDGFIRQLPLEHIARMGVNLKLFGKDWEKHPRLSRYACGPVENGTELNKLFNATKINLQLHLAGTTNQRFVEGAAAGGFFLVKHLKKDEGPLSHHYQKGEEFVFFHSLDELEQKIFYYLDHEGERKRIGLNAHRKTLEHYTYTRMCKELLEIIAKNPNDISL